MASVSTRTVWRTVKLAGVHYNPGFEKSWATGGSNILRFVECGHESPRKISRGVPKRGRCPECEQLRDGMRQKQLHSDGTETLERWNPETMLPERITRPRSTSFD